MNKELKDDAKGYDLSLVARVASDAVLEVGGENFIVTDAGSVARRAEQIECSNKRREIIDNTTDAVFVMRLYEKALGTIQHQGVQLAQGK